MKIIKKVAPVLASLVLCLSSFSLPAYAESVRQDGLEVSLSTDKETYEADENIKAELKVTNNDADGITDIKLENIAPEGYVLADGEEATKSIAKLEKGESVSLEVIYVPTTDESSGSSDSSNDSNDSKSDSDTDNSTSSDNNSSNPSTSSDSKEDNSSSSKSDNASNSSNGSSGNNNTSNNTAKTNPASDNNPQTGDDNGFALAIAAVAVLTAICSLKTKQGKKMLSIVLAVVMVGSSTSRSTIMVNAAEESDENVIYVSAIIKVDGTDMTINGKVSYGGYNINIISSYGGSVNGESGNYKANSLVEIEAIPDEGWIFLNWESTNGGEFKSTEDSKTTFTTPNNSTTVVARFIQEDQENMDADELDVYLAYNALEIGYSLGDYSDSVTNNLTFPVSYGEDEHVVNISWTTTDLNVVSEDGSVNRPHGFDESVSITATLSKGKSTHTKQFDINVIKSPEIVTSEIHDNSEEDLEALNENAEYEMEIEYNEDESQVVFISGKFSEISVNSIDTAISSIYSVKSLIGLTNPLSELSFNAVNHDEYTLAYSFGQTYNGISVYGRTVTVNADVNSGETRAINSNVLANTKLSGISLTPSISIESLSSKYDINRYELIIYSLNDYEESPVLAYLIHVDDEVIIVNADNADEILRFQTTNDWGDYSTTGSGKNELGETVTFPVQFHQWDWWFFYLEDVQRKIYVHGDKAGPIEHEFNSEWGDKTANSAYTNVITVYDWYRSHLNRNSIDNNGMAINVNVHNFKNEKYSNGNKITDNAHWDGGNSEMCFFENSSGGTPTTAAGLDVIAHEMTHGVFQYSINQRTDAEFPYSGYTGSINEGYADVFGYLVDNDDWTMGENWRTIRSLSDPESMGAPSTMSSPNYYSGSNQSTLVHTNSSIVYHAAYLMHSYGIRGNKLEKLWYNSMSQGYNAASTFKTVRKNLIQAGKNLHFSDAELANIRKAFDDEEVYDERGSMELTYTDAEGNSFHLTTPTYAKNAEVSLKRKQNDVPETEFHNSLGTTAGHTYDNIYFGTYELRVSVPGYETFITEIKISKGKTTSVTVPLSNVVVGTLSGKICQASDKTTPIENALVSVYKDDTLVKTETSDAEGNYTSILPVGDYRIVISADGYVSFDSYTTVQDDSVTYLETFLLVDESDAESGIARGTITDALTGVGLENVRITVRNGWNNASFGDVVTTTNTDSNGEYSLTLPLGNYTLYATKENYVSNTVNIVVQEGETSSQNGTLTPISDDNTYRIVLTWGENPRDLDSHVYGQLSDGDSFHVYYNHKTQYDGETKVCDLDVDDTTSYGPETITLNPTTNDSYYYYIYRYAGSGTVASSGAQIRLYRGDDLVRTFNVPTNLGESDYWNVFAIKNGEIIIQNSITDDADTTYAE